jgi:hypothetical protein
LFLVLSLAAATQQSPDTLHSVDLYGLRTVSEAALRRAIGLQSGDRIPVSFDALKARVRAIPGVADVDVAAPCCSETGRRLLYVGIRETATPAVTHRPAPRAEVRLPANVAELGAKFEEALRSAVLRGVVDEDQSLGYSLAQDSVMRAVQQSFIDVAARQLTLLEDVLHNSADAWHRALAAQIIAYGADRKRIAQQLLYASSDSDEEVRNNAARALGMLGQWANANPQAGVSIPLEPFLDFANSVSWTDRNKGVFVLFALTASRDPAVLAAVRARTLTSLVEMARWTHSGHALLPFLVVARLAGVRDDDAFGAMQSGKREEIIARALAVRN